MVAVARELGLATHLDGARLANAALAIGRTAAEIGGLFDTVTLCFSKGLGCPLGAVLAGSRELMARARIEKHRLGGAMRQAGIVAAAGLYALEHNVERLADDHARARRLAEGWDAAGVPVDLDRVQTNFVQIDVSALGLELAGGARRSRAPGCCSRAPCAPGSCARSRTSTSPTTTWSTRLRASRRARAPLPRCAARAAFAQAAGRSSGAGTSFGGRPGPSFVPGRPRHRVTADVLAGAAECEQHEPRRPGVDELATHARADAHRRGRYRGRGRRRQRTACSSPSSTR